MSLRAALLGLLSESPATGYELIKDFDVSSSVIWSAPKGEVYRELARLEADGFAARESQAGPRGQRKWHITTKGRAELKRWLFTRADYRLRYEPMLRAVFLGSLSQNEIRTKVAEDRAYFESELTKLSAARAQATSKRHRRRFGLAMAIHFFEAMLSWCDEADRLSRRQA